jgi:sulfatase maturation enzyme AslB (radical SAM superfamily)
MSWETARQALDWALAAAGPGLRVAFTGGEPLLALPLIRRSVAYVRSRSQGAGAVQFVLQTNGMLLDPETVGFLARHSFEVRLSFDGVPAAQGLRSRGTFPFLDNLLDRIKQEHPEFHRRRLIAAFTLLPESVGRLADSVRYFLDKGMARIGISPSMLGVPDWRPERIEELRDQFDRVRRLSLDHYRRHGNIPVLILRQRPNTLSATPERQLPCGVSAARAMAVDTDGSLLGCVMLKGAALAYAQPWLIRELEEFRIGRLTDSDLTRRIEKFRESARRSPTLGSKGPKYSVYGRCGDCPALGECVVCPVSIGLQPGNDDRDRMPDFACAFTRTAREARDRFQHAVDPAAARIREDTARRRPDPLERRADPDLLDAMRRVRALAESIHDP